MLLLTHSDRLLTPDAGHPSLIDIAVGLSRQPRFGGQSGTWWSVLDHSLFCDELAQTSFPRGVPVAPGATDDDEAAQYCRVAVLLHDAHESLTADVPTPFKTTDFKAVQDMLDRRIYDAFYPAGYAGFVDSVGSRFVKQIDRRAMRAEARLFSGHLPDRTDRIFGAPDEGDLDTLEALLQYSYAACPPWRNDQRHHPGVLEYLNRLLELM